MQELAEEKEKALQVCYEQLRDLNIIEDFRLEMYGIKFFLV